MFKKVIFLFLALPLLVFATSGGPGAPSSTGLHLLHSFWNDMSAKKADKISTYMSSQFQGISHQSVFDKYSELQMIKSLSWTNYSLTNLQQTERGNGIGAVLTITYTAMYSDDDNESSDSCMTTWLKVGEDDWRLMKHINHSELD